MTDLTSTKTDKEGNVTCDEHGTLPWKGRLVCCECNRLSNYHYPEDAEELN
ncbi:MAG: hypothetical protein ACE5F6_00405 [Anaerolineae bacterium]